MMTRRWATAAVVASVLLVVLSAGAPADDTGTLRATIEPIGGPLHIEIDPPKAVRLDKRVKVTAMVSNETGLLLSGVTVTLHADPTGLVLGGNPVVLGDLKADAGQSVKWDLTPTEVGSFVLVASVEGTTPAGHVLGTEGLAVVLEVIPKKSK